MYMDSDMDSTVYVSTTWMMDVIKGLMRHDRQAMIDFFVKEQDKRMLRHTNRLTRFGLLHEDLAPYLWPQQAESEGFWSFVRDKGQRESDLWRGAIVSSKDETKRALTLLKGFGLLGRADQERCHLAPGVLPPALLSRKPTLYVKECRFNCEFRYTALPAGAFHSCKSLDTIGPFS